MCDLGRVISALPVLRGETSRNRYGARTERCGPVWPAVRGRCWRARSASIATADHGGSDRCAGRLASAVRSMQVRSCHPAAGRSANSARNRGLLPRKRCHGAPIEVRSRSSIQCSIGSAVLAGGEMAGGVIGGGFDGRGDPFYLMPRQGAEAREDVATDAPTRPHCPGGWGRRSRRGTGWRWRSGVRSGAPGTPCLGTTGGAASRGPPGDRGRGNGVLGALMRRRTCLTAESGTAARRNSSVNARWRRASASDRFQARMAVRPAQQARPSPFWRWSPAFTGASVMKENPCRNVFRAARWQRRPGAQAAWNTSVRSSMLSRGSLSAGAAGSSKAECGA